VVNRPTVGYAPASRICRKSPTSVRLYRRLCHAKKAILRSSFPVFAAPPLKLFLHQSGRNPHVAPLSGQYTTAEGESVILTF
jgi:hypothetical protein